MSIFSIKVSRLFVLLTTTTSLFSKVLFKISKALTLEGKGISQPQLVGSVSPQWHSHPVRHLFSRTQPSPCRSCRTSRGPWSYWAPAKAQPRTLMRPASTNTNSGTHSRFRNSVSDSFPTVITMSPATRYVLPWKVRGKNQWPDTVTCKLGCKCMGIYCIHFKWELGLKWVDRESRWVLRVGSFTTQ